MKNLLLLLIIIPLSCLSDEVYPPDREQILYLEQVNYRMSVILILSNIAKDTKAIRCQNENSEYCDKINEEEER